MFDPSTDTFTPGPSPFRAPISRHVQGKHLPSFSDHCSHGLPGNPLPQSRATGTACRAAHHRYWAPDHPGPKLAHLAEGDTLAADSGWACLDIGEQVTTRRINATKRGTKDQPPKALWVPCKCGRHDLTADADGHVAGFTLVTSRAAMGDPTARGAAA